VAFLIWDALFTRAGVWGFNEAYCLGLKLFMMPIEEWLFFFVIPFCSVFTHFVLKHLSPKFFLNETLTRKIAIVLIAATFVLLCTHFSKAYTVVDAIFLIVTLTLGVVFYLKLLQRFFLSFLIILIPFFIVNGILTGSMIDAPIVWYNDDENLGIRLATIPIEDVGYAFSMLFCNVMIFESLKPKQDVR
ncbi:MAG: lycopene cyclase domain-containing protein, partial [Flavobacteriales bacterium]|nr:lycopene cyclase domain-containing protein [Flavobacteriales bacterium]